MGQDKVKLLFLNYWSFSDGLCRATLYPNVQILSEMIGIKKIIITSFESNSDNVKELPEIDKSIFLSYVSKFGIKIFSILGFLLWIYRIAKANSINLILCKGSVAGTLGFILSKLISKPFIVESFEPHSHYMVEGGEWSSFGIKNLIQRYFEKKQRKNAYGLITVTNNYKRKLISLGCLASKLYISPCPVIGKDFCKDERSKSILRRELGLKNHLVGLCIGKYGGIYLGEEMFSVIKAIVKERSDFRLIWLVNDHNSLLQNKLEKHNLSQNVLFIGYVDFNTVTKYIGLSDFGICNVKPGKFKKYLCPIKNGEYWAGGLPILMSGKVGDDWELMQKYNAGASFTNTGTSLALAVKEIVRLVEDKKTSDVCQRLAEKYRNPQITRSNYRRILRLYAQN